MESTYKYSSSPILNLGRLCKDRGHRGEGGALSTRRSMSRPSDVPIPDEDAGPTYSKRVDCGPSRHAGLSETLLVGFT